MLCASLTKRNKDRDLGTGSLDPEMLAGMRSALALPTLSKGEMLEMGHARMTLAVLLVACDRREEKGEARYRIEILDVYDGAEVIRLEPWDPLGALAN